VDVIDRFLHFLDQGRVLRQIAADGFHLGSGLRRVGRQGDGRLVLLLRGPHLVEDG
jgi:hypothetical protein